MQSPGIWYAHIWQFWSVRHLEDHQRWSNHSDVQLATMSIRVRINNWFFYPKRKYLQQNLHDLHRTNRRFVGFWTSTTTDSKRELDSFCRISLLKYFDLLILPFAGSVVWISVDTPINERKIHLYCNELSHESGNATVRVPCPGRIDLTAWVHFRFRLTNLRPTTLRKGFLNWNVSCICESLACRWWCHVMLALHLRWHGFRAVLAPSHQLRNRMLKSFAVSVS